jgi:hypothetical protein
LLSRICLDLSRPNVTPRLNILAFNLSLLLLTLAGRP